jgi:L-asparaginase / beta-aspartyl-peptidase
MHRWWLQGVTFVFCGVFMSLAAASTDEPVANVVLAVHGGTGLDKVDMTPELSAKLRAVLKEALQAGERRLKEPGATALDGVEVAIRILEDSPLLNAGRGAVFTHEGRNELDASIMDGKTKKAGAVAGVTVVKNPISAARAVMEQSKHVMMIGRGAEVFATQKGLEIVDPAYFWTEGRWKDIQKVWEAEKNKRSEVDAPAERRHTQYGTVGAIARDTAGNLAAGTSTGGMTNKMFGRVGDSPIIGAGTYADNDGAAVSCTGHGEYFIRYSVSHEIVAQVKYKKSSVKDAADDVINRQLKSAGGEGAAIVLSPAGEYAAAYNSEGLYRGWVTASGEIVVRLYED